MTPAIYHFDAATGLYVGSGAARPSPNEPGEFLLPAFSTFKQPIGAPAGKLDRFDLAADAWTLIDVPADPEPVVEAPSVPVPPTAEERLKLFQTAVQQSLDDRAKLAGYDGILSAITYADEPSVPKFQAEGLAFRAWRSVVWAACYDILASVQAGEREEPTLDALLVELPAFPGVPVEVPETDPADEPADGPTNAPEVVG